MQSRRNFLKNTMFAGAGCLAAGGLVPSRRDVYEEMKAGLFGWSGAFAHRPGFLV